MTVRHTRTTSDEQLVALCRQHYDKTPSSSKLNSTSPVNGWGDNVKIRFPWVNKNGRTSFWPGYNGTQSNHTVACADQPCQGWISSNGHNGEIYCNDYYNTNGKPHNAIWCVTWNPYPFAAKGISFNMKTKTTGVGWGFGNMWLLYQKPNGTHVYAPVKPNWNGIWKSKNPYSEQWKFHTKRLENYSDVDCQDVSNSNTWANFQGGVHNPAQPELNGYMCVGWAGFLTIMNRAGASQKHGFTFEDFYLLPDAQMPRTHDSDGNSGDDIYYWVGGKCDTASNIQKGDRRILLQDP